MLGRNKIYVFDKSKNRKKKKRRKLFPIFVARNDEKFIFSISRLHDGRHFIFSYWKFSYHVVIAFTQRSLLFRRLVHASVSHTQSHLTAVKWFDLLFALKFHCKKISFHFAIMHIHRWGSIRFVERTHELMFRCGIEKDPQRRYIQKFHRRWSVLVVYIYIYIVV